MSFSPSSPVTGATITGLTSPTYTIVQDVAPTPNGKQYYVSALGGTQTGVSVHSVASPFTLAFFKPYVLRLVQLLNVNGLFRGKNGRNQYKLIVRKGVTPYAAQPAEAMIITITMDIPAGSDSYDAVNIKAGLSLAFGAAWAQASGLADSVTTGTL